MLVNKDLLKIVAKEKKHTFISTGLSTMDDIKNATEIFRKSNCPFELMHCVSTYPMNHKDANLNAIKTYEKLLIAMLAEVRQVRVSSFLVQLTLGITSLERHITLDRAMYGSDQAASLEPDIEKSGISSKENSNSTRRWKKRIIKDEIPIAKKLREHLIVNIVRQ